MRNTSKKIKVLMVGTDRSTGGGMWTVANGYISSKLYNERVSLRYIPTYVVGSRGKRIFFALRSYTKIFFYFIKNKPQILHVHMSEKGSVYRKGIVIKVARVFKCKVLIHMHGAEFQSWYESLGDKKKKKVRGIINQGDKIVILGKYWNNFVSTIVPLKKIEVVYNAVPHQNYSYNPDGNTLLFLGVVGQRKGAYDLIKAFSEVEDKIPDNIKLCLYGPDYEGKINQIINERETSERIQYCGWLDNKKKNDVFKDVICNILPSYNEGLPMTILETMSVGIPNIATSIAAIPEVVNDNNGAIISPGDISGLKEEIICFCCNRKMRIDKSKNAYNTIENSFTVDKNINSILTLYKKMIQ